MISGPPRAGITLPSSSGQDAALSRLKQGFDSPRERQICPRSYRGIASPNYDVELAPVRGLLLCSPNPKCLRIRIDNGGASDAQSESQTATREGHFRGGNVSGPSYVCGPHSGSTDANGTFTCEPDVRVTFYIGALVLGETECATIAHAAAFIFLNASLPCAYSGVYYRVFQSGPDTTIQFSKLSAVNSHNRI
jgi:hypothetical protein